MQLPQKVQHAPRLRCTRQHGNWKCISMARGWSTGNPSGVFRGGGWKVGGLVKSLGSLTQENGFNARVSAGVGTVYSLSALPPSLRPCAEELPEDQRGCGLPEGTQHISCRVRMRAQCPWLSLGGALCSGLSCPCCLTPPVLWMLSRVIWAAVASG